LYSLAQEVSALRIDQVHPYCLGEHNLEPLTQPELESIAGWSPDFPQAPLPPSNCPDAAVVVQSLGFILRKLDGKLDGLTRRLRGCRTEDENGQPYFNLLE